MSSLMKRRGAMALGITLVIALSLSGAMPSSATAPHAASPVSVSDVRSVDDALVAGRSHTRAPQSTTSREASVAVAVINRPQPPQPPPVRGSSPKKPPSGGGSVAAPADCNGYSGNRKTGCALLLAAGFGMGQMGCLNSLWNRESGWRTTARNPSSGAYGIPQSLPGNKMATAGADWQTNPVTQIKWGLGYIKGRYKTPCGAWAHSQATGWY